MEKQNNGRAPRAGEAARSDRADKRTQSYKHVKLERERPKLTKEGKALRREGGGQQNARRDFASPKKDPSATLKIIPLGGLDAIGKNMTVFECKGDMILDDAGLMFPDDNHPGVDLILPDYTYVLENADKLRGIVITHGHEDHTGTLPYLLKDLDRQVPIYATKLTLGLIEGKLAEHRIKNAKLVEIKPGDQVKLGCFTAEFFAVNHSIPGAVGVFFQSPAGNVLHTGDFKLDQTPIDGVTTDFGALAKFSEIGVDLLMSDSTNAQNANFTPSEATVGVELSKIIAQAKGRVIIASFASHIHRMQQICDAAIANGRKVVVTGRSMIQNTDIARRLGYLDIDDSDLIDAYDLKGIPPEQVVIMCTGSQGEPLSALARISNGEHRTIEIDEGDTVIVSATPVPGNEKAVTRVINSLAKIGADVYDKNRARVHVSGHAGAEELKIVLSIVRPKAFMPVHGEATHLRAHAKLAEATGVPHENVFVCENGESLEAFRTRRAAGRDGAERHRVRGRPLGRRHVPGRARRTQRAGRARLRERRRGSVRQDQGRRRRGADRDARHHGRRRPLPGTRGRADREGGRQARARQGRGRQGGQEGRARRVPVASVGAHEAASHGHRELAGSLGYNGTAADALQARPRLTRRCRRRETRT